MYPTAFTYQRAHSVQEALALLAQHADAKLMAGGHSLLPTMKLRLATPAAIVDLSGVQELRGIRGGDGGAIAIGAMTTHREIERSALLKGSCPILPEAAALIGDPLVRNRGTIGGSLAHADPAADFPACTLVLGATFDVEGPNSRRRTIAADDFFQGLFTTALADDEILTAVHVPATAPGTGMAYEKFPHPASRYAIVGIAAVVTIAEGTCRTARVAVTGAMSHAQRLPALEAALVGKALDAPTIASACKGLVAPDDLLGDQFASAEYRAHLVDVLASRALTRAVSRA